MVHFEDANKLLQRIWLPMGRMSTEALRNQTAQEDTTELLRIRRLMTLDYKLFTYELKNNLASLAREEYVGYLQEVAALFTFPVTQLQSVNDLMQRLALEHAGAYQDVAWTEMQRELTIHPATNQACANAFMLLLIATGGAAYYQAALNEVERLIRLYTTKPPKPKTENSSTATYEFWEGRLVPGFTLKDLDHLLVSVGMLEDIQSRTLTEDAKPGAWVGVVEALIEAKKLIYDNKQQLHKAIIARYKPKSFSPSTIRAYNSNNQYSKRAYNRAKAFL
jgi:hypothetical protein